MNLSELNTFVALHKTAHPNFQNHNVVSVGLGFRMYNTLGWDYIRLNKSTLSFYCEFHLNRIIQFKTIESETRLINKISELVERYNLLHHKNEKNNFIQEYTKDDNPGRHLFRIGFVIERGPSGYDWDISRRLSLFSKDIHTYINTVVPYSNF